MRSARPGERPEGASREGPKVPLAAGGSAAGDDGARESAAAERSEADGDEVGEA